MKVTDRDIIQQFMHDESDMKMDYIVCLPSEHEDQMINWRNDHITL